MGNNIHKEDLGGAGHAQDIFDLVHPIAQRSPANGETALADMMRRHGLLAAGEQISDLKVTTKKQRSVRPRTISKISAAIVDIHTKAMQRIVILKNDGGKYSLDFR